jgi:PTH2 family peptidyl-tRNA hydrolase
MADRTPPTPTAMLIGTAIFSLATGYMLGMASSLGFLPNPFSSPPPTSKSKSDTSHYDDEEESSEEEIDDGVIIDHAPNWANGEEADRRDGLRASAPAAKEKERVNADWNLNEECKLVLVVRTDLGMTKGELSACYFQFARIQC